MSLDLVCGASGVNLEALQFAPRRSVVVIGRHNLQNKLLASLIDQRSGCRGLVRSVDGLDEFPLATNALALLDIESFAATELGTHLQSLSTRASCRNIAIINAHEKLAFEHIVARPGVKGVFFRDTSQENLIKGIRAIFQGDYWLPRKILCEHLERTRRMQRTAAAEATLLTRKEIETLKLVAAGDSTLCIASKLNVSTHTVKTHLYNVFRKLRVRNRVQAAHWAMQNIDGLETMLR